jgi:hypothetical protein
MSAKREKNGDRLQVNWKLVVQIRSGRDARGPREEVDSRLLALIIDGYPFSDHCKEEADSGVGQARYAT